MYTTIIIISIIALLCLTPVNGKDACPPEGCQPSNDKIEMEYRYLGPSGLLVSSLSYGNMFTFEQVGVDGSLEIMKYLVDNGVNYFDTAEAYGKGQAETLLGEVIEKGIQLKYWERDDLVISTKIFWGRTPQDILKFPNKVGLSRKHIIEGFTKSLKRLRLSYVDIVFCHRPDFDTPLEETVRAMDWLIHQGLAFYWGTSEWTAEHIREAHDIADRLNLIHPIVEQPEYSLLARERFENEYAPLYDNPGLGTTIWGVLAAGILSGKYAKGIPEDTRLGLYPQFQNRHQGGVEKALDLQSIADELGCTLSQLSIAWALKNPHVSTIVMGGKLKYLKENLDSLKIVPKLTPEVLEKIEKIVKTKPVSPIDWKKY